MPSLREMAEQRKAATAAEVAKQEKEAKAETVKAAKAQLGEIGSRLQKMEALKQQLPSTRGELRAAKESFKEKRRVIKDVTKDLDDINVRELVRNPDSEFEEVKEYQEAFSTYKEKQDEAGDIRKLVESEFGVSYAELKPGQVEMLIEERQKELQIEQEAVVRANPEADPELYKEIYERRVEEKAGKLFADGVSTKMQSELYSNFYTPAQGSERRDRSLVLKKDVDVDRVVQQALTKIEDPDTKAVFFKKLEDLYKGNAMEDPEIDVEALKRAIAKQLLKGSNFHDGYQSEVAEKITGKKIKDDESQERFTKLVDEAAERVAQAPAMKITAEKLMGEYKEYAEYKALPKQIEAVDKRLAEIDPLLSNSTRSMADGSRVEGIPSRLDSLGRAESNFARQIETSRDKLAALGKFGEIQADIEGLPAAAQETEVSLTSNRDGVTVRIETYLQPLQTEVTTLEEKKQALERSKTKWEGTKNGLFGPSDEKKRELARIAEELPKVEQELKAKQDELDAKNEARTRAAQVTKEIGSRLEDLKGEDRLQYRGTLKGLAEHLSSQKAPLTEAFNASRTLAEEQKQEIYNQRVGLSTEQAALEEEKRNLGTEKEKLVSRQKQLALKYQALATNRY